MTNSRHRARRLRVHQAAGPRRGPVPPQESQDSPFETFRREWRERAEEDARIDAACRQWDAAMRAKGTPVSEAYLAQRQAAQQKLDQLGSEIRRTALMRAWPILNAQGQSAAGAVLLFATLADLVPELRTARLAQEVLSAAGALAVPAPLWAAQKLADVVATAGQSKEVDLHQTFGLKATKGKTSAKEAGVMRRRDVALVLAVEQLRAQHGMSLDDACDRVATTTGRISPGTLVNTYAKLKRDGWVPELLGLVQHLFPRDEEELRAAYRDLGFRLCQDLDFALSLPMPPSILIERTCLNCDTLFTTSDRMIRLCPACQPRVPHL